MATKTWQVGPYHDVWCAVVHADTRSQARSALLCELEWTEIRAIRLPTMDGKPVTVENLIEAGFPEEWEGEPIQARPYTWFCNCDLCKGGSR